MKKYRFLKRAAAATLALFMLLALCACTSPAGKDGQATPEPTAEAAAPAETPKPTEAIPTPRPTPDLGGRRVVEGLGHYNGVGANDIEMKPGEVWLLGSLPSALEDPENEGCLFDVQIEFLNDFVPEGLKAYRAQKKQEAKEAAESPAFKEFMAKFEEWKSRYDYVLREGDELPEGASPEAVLWLDEQDEQLIEKEMRMGVDLWLVALRHLEGELPQRTLNSYSAAIDRYVENSGSQSYLLPNEDILAQFEEYAQRYLDAGYILVVDQMTIGVSCGCRAFLTKEQIEALPLDHEANLYVYFFNEANFGGRPPVFD